MIKKNICQKFGRLAARLCLMSAIALTCACGGPALTMNMAGLPNVNPDSNGRPSPVLVKMYELQGDLLFKNAELLPLFQDPINTLGADLVSMDEFTLVPGEAKTLVYLPSLKTTHVGVVASFRRQDLGPWKIIKPIDPEKKTIMALELNGASLIMLPDKEAKKWDPVEAVDGYRENSIQRVPVSSTTTINQADYDPNDNYDDTDNAVY
ncbi:type VI secretion system lipoprotein TssJ [Deltaproteobacteria bacterium Smac51]|nr:type VI secretion system lipoprotein TssJ [Deltaproteobacteria bacterium Smac51]